MNRNNLNHLKETNQENLLDLKRGIDNKSLNEIVEFNGEWSESYVIITSSQDKIYNPETDEDDWYGRQSECAYVLTKNSKALPKFFAYGNEA